MHKAYRSPVIIMGMHRSGTTMIAKLLRDMGMFTGWYLEENHESRFFYDISEKLLHACNGSWENPSALDNLLRHQEMRRKVANSLRNDLSSYYSLYYLGPKLYLQYKSMLDLDFSWGWKEPRNTYLLPIWLDIFPEARIIHIYRNGLDVAKSLASREKKRLKTILTENKGTKTIITSQINQIRGFGSLRYVLKKVQSKWRKLDYSDKYSKLGVHSCLSIEQGFKLWCTYIERAEKVLDNVNENHVYSIKYEDFLEKPDYFLKKLQIFCNIPSNEQKILSLKSTIKTERRYAYKNDAELRKYYDLLKDNIFMLKLGYGIEK